MGGAQRWQNRWSIVYELGKLLEVSKNNLGFMYTIGHGLFIKNKFLQEIGGYNENDLNEDNEFGYRLRKEGLKIYPIPFLEKSGFASNLSIYIKQQAVWFNGPLYAFGYFLKSDKNSKNFFLALLNFKAAISWLLSSVFMIFFTLYSVMIDPVIFFLLLILDVLYITGLNIVCDYLLNELRYKKI